MLIHQMWQTDGHKKASQQLFRYFHTSKNTHVLECSCNTQSSYFDKCDHCNFCPQLQTSLHYGQLSRHIVVLSHFTIILYAQMLQNKRLSNKLLNRRRVLPTSSIIFSCPFSRYVTWCMKSKSQSMPHKNRVLYDSVLQYYGTAIHAKSSHVQVVWGVVLLHDFMFLS